MRIPREKSYKIYCEMYNANSTASLGLATLKEVDLFSPGIGPQ
jgi:hypothetical protein